MERRSKGKSKSKSKAPTNPVNLAEHIIRSGRKKTANAASSNNKDIVVVSDDWFRTTPTARCTLISRGLILLFLEPWFTCFWEKDKIWSSPLFWTTCGLRGKPPNKNDSITPSTTRRLLTYFTTCLISDEEELPRLSKLNSWSILYNPTSSSPKTNVGIWMWRWTSITTAWIWWGDSSRQSILA
jgi:hypothetical protein